MNANPAANDLPLPSLDDVRDEQGKPVSQADFIGHWTVLWFYPAAATSG